ncbi:MAG: hypothetical protein IJ612_02640 [Prevotella sp.]|nr:hypothetical protein [Prevotella sp.]
MKKLGLLIVAALTLAAQGVSAQNSDDNNLFNHLSAGVSLGTTGIGIEVASPITSFLQLRAGYSFIPKIKINETADLDSSEDYLRKEDGTGYYESVDIEGKLNMGDLKLLVDYYPLKKSSFHVTAGAYIGKSKLATAYSTNHFLNQGYWGNSGPEMGSASQTYTIVSDPDGSVTADVKVNSFKPYLGIGFGRAVPNNRISVCFDFGVQFWGKPSLWTKIDDNLGTEYRKVEKSRILSQQDWCSDVIDALDIAEKIIVYPVLTLRVNGRIF